MLVKIAERALREDVIGKNLDAILKSINNRSLSVSGWNVEADLERDHGKGWHHEGSPGYYKYQMFLKIVFMRVDNKQPDAGIFDRLCRNIYTRSLQDKSGKWELVDVDDKEYAPPDPNETYVSEDFIGYSELVWPDDEEWMEAFSHLFGLDSHRRRLRSAIEAGEQSGWLNRYHSALIGPPGCGKSDLCHTLKTVLGDEVVMEYDATATTAAGAIKDLSEREILPRILIIEEIEKSDERQLTPLLSIMDMRSEIRKTTARATIQRDTKLFVIATVNNVPLFKKMASGALASRFAHHIYFKRPNRDQLMMILQREIDKVNGDWAWIEPTLDWCDRKQITDPRNVTAICLCGRDELLTGEYQKMLEDTESPEGVMDFDDTGLVEDWTVG